MLNSYVIIRSRDAGCFAGTLLALDGDKATLSNSRRLWYWAGAASLSELAQMGTSEPEHCKFPCSVDFHIVLGVIEILLVTASAEESIKGVPIWSAK